jgi:hypothetical protein
MFRDSLAVPGLVPQPPDVGAGRAAPRQAARGRDQHGTPATTDVEHVLVAAQAEFVEQPLPDRQLARAGAVEVAGRDGEHPQATHPRQRADQALAPPAGPPLTSQQAAYGQHEHGNAAVASIDAVAGPVSPHRTEWARPVRARPATRQP